MLDFVIFTLIHRLPCSPKDTLGVLLGHLGGWRLRFLARTFFLTKLRYRIPS